MGLYIFDLIGKLGHWKKFYTNSSSLSYYFPTRTNILGILASILEMPRDSYYSLFSPENLKISISLRSRIRKKIFVMNYINTENYDGYTQIKLELLLPLDFLNRSQIKYRIYLSAENNKIEDILSEIKNRVVQKNYGYGVYFGQRSFMASIDFVDYISKEKINKINNCKEVHTTILKENIVNNGTLDWTNLERNYVIERIPIHFNKNREIELTKEIIGEINQGIISLNKGSFRDCFKIKYKEREENISFI